MDDDHDARTIHCGNLYAEKVTEELLYELFLQVCSRGKKNVFSLNEMKFD